MKNIVSSIILIISFVFGNSSYSQPTLPSANAGSFGKYVDQPVSHFTGTSSVNVPIATLSDGTLSTNVSLNYHTGGSRVAELAGPAGLGWTLLGSGAITRTVRGIADEINNEGYWFSGDVLNQTSTHIEEVADQDRDGEPDIFTYNFQGYQGKFFFDDNNDIHMVPKSDIKIEPYFRTFVQTHIEGFVVTTPDGTVYYFGYSDQDWQNYSQSYSFEYQEVVGSGFSDRVAWNLERIESFDKKHSIKFIYGRDYYTYKIWGDCQKYSAYYSGSTHYEGTCNISEVEVRMVASRLTKIETSTSEVTFFYNDRSDLYDHPSYPSNDPLKIYKIEIDNGTNFCTRFDLTQSYFTDGAGSDPGIKRLRLDEVRKRHCTATPTNTNSEQPWIFEYNGDFFPKYLSKRIDHWGYYNGAGTNDNLNDLVAYNSCYSGQCYGSAVRTTNESEMIKGSLKKVTYPTKGSVTFDYEANSYPEINSSAQTLLNIVSCDDFGSCCGTQSDEDLITLDQTSINNGRYELSLHTFGYIGCYATYSHNVYLYIYDQTTGGNLVHSKSFNVSNPGPGTTTVTTYLNTISSLTAGHIYKFKVISYLGKGEVEVISTPGFQNIHCGGLRIKRTTINDGISTSIVKNFVYDQFSNPGKSSGILSGEPAYAHYAYYANGVTTVVYNSTSIKPLSTLEGYHVAYENVTTDHDGNGQEKYTFFKETPSSSSGYPVDPPSAKLYQGNLLKHQALDDSATEISSNTITRNSADSYTNAPGLVYRAAKIRARISAGSSWQDRYVNNTYQNRTSIFRPSKNVSVLDGITTTNDIYYESSVVYGPTKSKVTNSDNKVHETRTSYTGDYSGGLNGVFDHYNMIGVPFKTEKYVGPNLLDGSETVYSNFNSSGVKLSSTNTSDYPRPYESKRYERTWTNGTLQSGNWNTKVTFKEYRSNGLIYKLQEDGWWDTYFDYYSNKLIKNKIYSSHWTEFEYHTGSNLLSKLIRPDDTYTTYTYDELMRLKTETENCNNTVRTYTYYNTSNISSTKNYVEKVVNYPSPSTLSDVDMLTSRVYQDGLGRDIQTVLKGQGPLGEDIINAVAYDTYGRINKKYETQSNSAGTGVYVTPSYSWDYTLTEFFGSPLNRIKKVTPLGSLSAIEYTYGSNASSEVKIDGGGSNYAANLLSKYTVKDGNGNKSIVFKDKMGRIVLSRNTNSSESTSKNLDTYTIYDDKNRATKILPPAVTSSQSELYYEYEYDGEDRLTEKKIPGADVVYFKYNSRHLLGGYQDGNLRNHNKWYTYTVDEFGREKTSGLYTGTPSTNFTPTEKLTENTYGTTGFLVDKITQTKSKILGTSNDWITTNLTYDDCGRVETTSSNSHMNLGASNALRDTFIYDGAGNNVQTTSLIDYGGTTTIVSKSELDGEGRVEKAYFKVGNLERIISKNEYNYKNQLITQYQGQTGNGKTGNLEYAQKIDYTYRQDGLLQKINDNNLTGTKTSLSSCSGLNPGSSGSSTYDVKDLFYSILHYDDPIGSSSSQENGNISNVEWQVRGRYQQMMAYTYDEYDRLTNADYYDHSGIAWSNTGVYDIDLTYDNRGNFQNITRKGKVSSGGCFNNNTIDNLSFSYYSNTNELKNVADSGSSSTGFKENSSSSTTYTYDANGNMISDVEKGITSISYNHLNLPTGISTASQSIEFTYDADGNLINKKHKNGSTVVENRDYVAGIEYVGGAMDAIYHSEGRVKYVSGSPRFEYYIRDHLGNNRILYCDLNADGLISYNFTNGISTDDEILEETHYYPFGMVMDGPWMTSGSMEYGYNGIEYEDFLGLDMNLASYRGLDPALGRWCQIDPKAEASKGLSPYNSMHNNPVKYTDPEGDFIPAAILGASIGLVTNGINNVANGNNFFSGGLKAAAFGALGGAASFGIGQAFGGAGNFGHELLRAGAHGVSGGIQSELAGGSFGSGFLGGAFASGLGSGIGATGLKGNNLVAAQFAGGGIAGGVGSLLGGGSFARGVANGMMVGGLNHAAHAGAFGEGFAVSLVTGKWRHILGPDAIHFTAGTILGAAPTVSYEKGKILFLRGKGLAGKVATMNESGVGVGLELASVNVSGTNLYYSGSTSQININTFQGYRYQASGGFTIKGIEVGANVSYSSVGKNEFVLGIGKTIGFGYGFPGVLYGVSGNINFGLSNIPK